MDLEKEYRQKVITAEEGAALVKEGDVLELGFAAIFPVHFDEALAARKGDFRHVVIRNGILSNPSKLLEVGEPFEWQSWHATPDVRRAIERGTANHIPIRYSEMPRYIRENVQTDILVLPVSEMDEHGYFNFGLDSSHFLDQARMAKTVVVEVNPLQPRVAGRSESEIHLRDVDFIIETEGYPVAALPIRSYTEVDEKIAAFVVERIEDGSTLQLGIGALPGAVGDAIASSSVKNLGVHTEMYVDSFMDMTLAGKITGAMKTRDKGRQVFAFIEGSEKLYRFADENPELMSAPVDYVNDARVIADQYRMVSINTALHVNLRGEVSSETVGLRHISGAGGQLDFALGSYLAPDGKGFICLHSSRVDKNGVRHSNIVPDFSAGTIVTMVAPVTQYVVTEYGVANLKGKSTYERAKALIAIAHPECREELIRGAKARGVWR
ncbi:putative butyryl-CoA:acetate CoA-transferase [Aedoeadaptatus coxii]|uniref:acetyl-CoA hydrolase/transferase family protein n=1 Tax=Aedoeadaptatus coxii TaxID=755172 RepID=UPI0017688226|nr:acetyl-CoA hydrolase/transferase C-terminal domain-containing protein [Peptoniphilus coxii]CAC9926516.1 putative butyryl-CoA:acetate CoA-transferase [Peptoniphilus coxii]